MAIEKALVTLLKPYVSNRVYPATLPENPVYPCITYYTLSHLANKIVNVQYPTFAIDLWTDTAQANVELRDTIVDGCDRKWSTTDGYAMRFNYLTYRNFYDTETKKFHGVIDAELLYKEV